MEIFYIILIGILYSLGFFMILRRSLVKVIIGIAILGHAANLLIFVVGKMTKSVAAFVPADGTKLIEPYADPVPQALILTAIVIGFGVQAFALVLFKKAYEASGSDDIKQLKTTDRIWELNQIY